MVRKCVKGWEGLKAYMGNSAGLWISMQRYPQSLRREVQAVTECQDKDGKNRRHAVWPSPSLCDPPSDFIWLGFYCECIKGGTISTSLYICLCVCIRDNAMCSPNPLLFFLGTQFPSPCLPSSKGHMECKSMGDKKWCASPVTQAIRSRSAFSTVFLFSCLSARCRGSNRNSGALGDNVAPKWKEPWCPWRQPTEHLIGDAEVAVTADSLPWIT